MRDGTGKLPMLDLHMDGENGAKTMVYNTKMNSKKEIGEKTVIKERKVEEIQQ